MAAVVFVRPSRRGGRAIVHDALGDTGYTRCGLEFDGGLPTGEAVDCPGCLPPGERPPAGHVDRQRLRYAELRRPT